MILYFAYAESLKLASIVIIYRLFVYQQGSSYCPHDLVVGWDNDFSTKLFLERLHYTPVKGNPTLKYHWGRQCIARQYALVCYPPVPAG